MKQLKHICPLILFVLFMLSSSNLFAGVTGKIAGIVLDAETGQPLPGVNVVIENHMLGASTDIEGYFVILQVPPGKYDLRFIMLGYNDLIVKEVKVVVDLTTKVDAKLKEQALTLDEDIVVTAERPVIQKDITASIQFVDAEAIERLPVTDTKEGLMLQAGVFFNPTPIGGGFQNSAGRGEQRYSVRGGSQDEVLWYIDGVRTTSKVAGRADWGGSFTNVNLNAVQEAQVLTGGFTAEYGEAQSGIVNIITKEGGQKLSASVNYEYSPPGQRHFGNYIYDRSIQKEFLDHTLEDGTLDPNWWTPYRQSQVYDYRKFDDHQIDLTLGGQLFNNNPLNFFLSARHKEQAYALPHPRDKRTSQNVMLNLSHKLAPTMKLKIIGMFDYDAHSTLQEIGDFSYQAKYYRGWGSILDKYTYLGSINFAHTLSQNLFYDLKLSYFLVDFYEGPSKFTVLGSSAAEDQTIWGYHRYEGLIDEPFDKYATIVKNHQKSGDLSFVGDVSWQFNKSNLFKSGFEFRYNTYADLESYRFPTFTTDKDLWLNRSLMETYHPIQLAAFVQDKMEFESMILNIGLRYDYLNPNLDWFDNEGLYNLAIDPLYDASLDPDGDQIDSNGHIKYAYENILNKPRSPARTYHMFSPRLGVSFPVSENSLLHFNYGHFYQMPSFDFMFNLGYFRPQHIVDDMAAENELAAAENREPEHIPSPDGDPERVVSFTTEPLPPQKTIMFEVGLKYNFEDFAVLNVTAYYKNVSNQTEELIGLFDRKVYGYDPYRDGANPTISYTGYFPGDYGDSKGFEISLGTLFNQYYMLDLNYAFSVATQGRASPSVITLSDDGESSSYEWSEEVNKRIPIQKAFSRPHILRANLYLQMPEDPTDTFADLLLNDMTSSILYMYVSGQAFTYLSATDAPDTYDNYRYPAYQTVNLRIDKTIEFWKDHNITLYLRVNNLFNTKNLRSIGDNYYFSSTQVLADYVKDETVRKTDEFGYDISWQTYHQPRQIFFGLKYFLN